MPDLSRAAPGRGVLGGFLSLSSGEILARFIAFIGTTYLTRVLGPEGFGILGLAGALCGYFALAVSAGFTDVGAREVARNPSEAPAIALGATGIRALLALGALALLAGLTLLLPKPTLVKLVIVLSGLSFFSLALDTSWVYKGLERTRSVAVALVVGQAIYVALVLAVVRDPGDVARVPLAQVAGEVGAATLLLVPLLGTRARPDFREGWTILKGSGFVTLTRLFRTFIYTFDVVLIGLLLGEREVGLYSAAYRFCFLLLAVGSALHVAYLPVFAKQASMADRAAIAGRSVHLSSALAVPMVVGGGLLAGPLLTSTFGGAYVEAVAPFRLLLLSLGFIFLNGTVHNLLLVLERTRAETRLIGVAAVLNVGLNLYAIPRFGLLGAAAATALAEAVVLGMGIRLLVRAGVRIETSHLPATLVAAVVMALVLLGAGLGSSLVVLVPLGTGVYVTALWLLRGVPADVMEGLPGRRLD